MRLVPFFKRNKSVFFVIAVAAMLVFLIVGLFHIDNTTNLMIIEYLGGFGWQVEESPFEISYLTVPEEFDAVYHAYNALQKTSGFDLEAYKGKKVARYSYRVLNHQSSETDEVTAGIFVYENTIIAGDISSSSENGFMHAVSDTSYIIEK